MNAVYVVEWVAEYGDEGEGREVVAVYESEDDARHHANTEPPPYGFSDGGRYHVHEPVPFVPKEETT